MTPISSHRNCSSPRNKQIHFNRTKRTRKWSSIFSSPLSVKVKQNALICVVTEYLRDCLYFPSQCYRGWTFKRCCYGSSLLFNILPHTHQRCSWLASLCSRSCSPDWTIELQCSQLILCSVYKSSLSSYLDLNNILQRLHSDGCSCTMCSCRFCLALKVFSQETHSINVFTSDCWFETPLDSVVHCELPRPCVEPACVTWHAMKLNGLF